MKITDRFEPTTGAFVGEGLFLVAFEHGGDVGVGVASVEASGIIVIDRRKRREVFPEAMRSARCDHPAPWLARGRILLDPEKEGDVAAWRAIDFQGTSLRFDECRLCGRRFAPRFDVRHEYAPERRPQDEEAPFRRSTLRDEALAAGLIRETGFEAELEAERARWDTSDGAASWSSWIAKARELSEQPEEVRS
ncbi:hypothetical protein UFOVP1383_15 [uncultured Caudovirales phage]|uniref:Uncharacterized protein n=1 Tax=uncultured Caudovirales phage TaxID=2100421 RepID=A0A6J5Q5V0_9CAUD|nr:hypothetical protein UFOVP848_26 [uncultured Caudovirales phage]CAB4173345.1 hypothetical protein UFOVP945_39 [uncultured Caudovirales phage]CAB4179589.1 hypothetical protein UFOVP1023_3 [uncultured Caudovirales phage]CAB4203916.1 hypothetical protein UFOVP1383_15 [uncultured Caudovirales phage]CAB4215964.1 hypothetical protein UFOVP1477_33 [uncultured Caudovirales phage]